MHGYMNFYNSSTNSVAIQINIFDNFDMNQKLITNITKQASLI